MFSQCNQPFKWISVTSVTIILVCFASLSLGHQHNDYDFDGAAHTIATLPKPLVDLTLILGNDPSMLLFSCTLLLTVFPLILMLVLPKTLPSPIERILVSFALGTMLSDVFLHLLPETLSSDAHIHENDHHHHRHHLSLSSPAFKLLGGFLTFYTVERIMNLLMDMSSVPNSCELTKDDHHDQLNHDINSTYQNSNDMTAMGLRMKNKKSSIPSGKGKNGSRHSHSSTSAPTSKSIVPVSALIHVAATSIHVASDGLLLSMAFVKGPTTGLSTFLGLFLHEIPHRLSDWALLQGSLKMSHRQALIAQIWLSAVSVSGVIAGTMVVSKSALDHIMPVVAGGLLYVVTVGVMPDLLGGHHHHHDHHHPPAVNASTRMMKLCLAVIELVSVGAGIFLMDHHEH